MRNNDHFELWSRASVNILEVHGGDWDKTRAAGTKTPLCKKPAVDRWSAGFLYI